jgi:hypothetical protein
MLEPVEIRPPGLVQGYNFAVDNGVGWEIIERLGDLRESFIEVLVVPRVQDCFAARSDSDGAVAVQLHFIGPVGTLGKRRDQSAFHWLYEFSLSFNLSRARFVDRAHG